MLRAAVVAGMLVAGCSEDLPNDECGGIDYHPVVHTRTLDQLPMLMPSVSLGPAYTADPYDPDAREISIYLPYGTPFAARGHAPIEDADGGRA